MRVVTLCHNCVRYHPKAKGNCILARDWMRLQRKHKYTLMVLDCPQYIAPKEVFPLESNTATPAEDNTATPAENNTATPAEGEE